MIIHGIYDKKYNNNAFMLTRGHLLGFQSFLLSLDICRFSFIHLILVNF